ncbi:MAG: hypothetical protein ACQEXJ_03740 [Myxococcota bacterium]
MRRLMLRVALTVSAAALALTLLAPAASAQAGGRAPQVIELEEMVIEGKVAKPQVFYVLGRSTIRYRSLRMDRTFVHRIIETAKKNPF